MTADANARTYDPLAKSFHWLVVALLIAQFTLGWTMPHVGRATLPVGLIFWHISVGMLILVVVLARLGWRLVRPVPLVKLGVPPWQHWTARITHDLLYVALFVQILLGWANASARAFDVDVFGVVKLPAIAAAASSLAMTAGDIHDDFAWVLLALIGLHVAAALYHYFVLRDRTLQRMLTD